MSALLSDVERDEDSARQFVCQAKTLGLTPTEIGDILDIRHDGAPPCEHVLRMLDERLADVDRTITELQQLRRALTASRGYAATKAFSDHPICGIIEIPHSATIG